jgi:ATP-binding cassette subfamily B protein
MEREAFARAWRFLSYHPGAKWAAMTAAVGTGVLYVALLAVVGLFVDLMVNRGRIPSFDDLPRRQQERFWQRWASLPEAQRFQSLVKEAGVEANTAREVVKAGDPTRLASREREVLWRKHVAEILQSSVGPAAAGVVREAAADQPLTDLGVLSLVVRSEHQLYLPVVGALARWNAWTWQRGNTPYLTGLLLVAAGLALLRAVLMYLMTTMGARATIEATTRLRRAIYHHTFRLGTLAFRALGPIEAVGVFTRHLEAVHEGLYTRLTVFYREPVKFGLLLAFALAVNFWLALAFFLFALLVWLIGGQLATYFRRKGREAVRTAANQLALIQESLMLMRLVKTYLMELFNQARVERQLARYAKAQLRRYQGEAVYRPVLVFLGTLAALILLYVAGLVVLNRQLGVPSTITLSIALVSLYWPLVSWLEHRRYLRRARSSAVVLFNFLDRPGEVGQVVGAEFLPPLGKQLEFDGVSLHEPGTGRVLLQDVSLTIQAGQRVAIVGSDDVEKHALVYLIPRFLDPTSGEIRVDNHNLRWVTLDSLRAQIALVLQNNLVFNDTVANNIGCGDPSYTLPQIIEAAKIARAHQFVQKLPRGYETPIGEMGHPLRISEQFRIALARAILRDPALLIIEEPFTPLDDESKALLDDTFARVLPGRTAIFLPHRVSTIRSCDRVFLLHKGRLEGAGEHRELLTQNELYRHLQYLEFNVFAEQA